VLKDPAAASFLEHFDYAWSLAAAADARGERLVDFIAALEPKMGQLDRFDEAVLRESSRGVSIMTVHMSKGLEFPVVVIAGMEQGLFPRDDDTDEDLEEQRRLFYVALTRAKDELHITYCKRRLFRGRVMDYPPSRFLAEVPREMLRPFGGKLDLSAAEAAAAFPTRPCEAALSSPSSFMEPST